MNYKRLLEEIMRFRIPPLWNKKKQLLEQADSFMLESKKLLVQSENLRQESKLSRDSSKRARDRSDYLLTASVWFRKECPLMRGESNRLLHESKWEIAKCQYFWAMNLWTGSESKRLETESKRLKAKSKRLASKARQL